MFVNLINNAVQAIENAQAEAGERGGEAFIGHIVVSLRLSTKEGFYDIVFEDNGPGVSDDKNRARLFTPNFTTKSNGTGLGLSISRNILRMRRSDFYSKSFALKGAC